MLIRDMNMSSAWWADFEAEAATRQAQLLWRDRWTVSAREAPYCEVGGRRLLSFASNDYLGLMQHPVLAHAMVAGVNVWGAGAGASHVVCGHMVAHHAFELAAAEFVGMSKALLLSSGYMANLAVLTALVKRNDVIFADRLNHASLVDGAVLARARLRRYRHADANHLAELLQQPRSGRALIVTDAVFSMDGDIAPLAALLDLAERYDALLVVDDAHGLGVLGPQGRGSLAALGLASERLILVGTLGKAVGLMGAFIAGDAVVIDHVEQQARTYIYTTAMPPACAEALTVALSLVASADEARAQVNARMMQLRQGIEYVSMLRLLPSDTPIQPLWVGANQAVLDRSHALRESGLWVPAIRPPTVPVGSARLRISLSARHTAAHVSFLLSQLEQVLVT